MRPTPAPVIIRPVRPEEADALRELRIEALRTCPLAFTADLAQTESRPAQAWREQAQRCAGDGTELIMLSEERVGGDAGRLVGMAGVYTSPQPKLAHVGTVWGVYVRPAARGRGVGEGLIRACIDWARGRELVTLKLSVVEGNDAARRCYERCGFTVYAVEPLAVRWEGRLHDEVLMVQRL